jgi:hypothetical protein
MNQEVVTSGMADPNDNLLPDPLTVGELISLQQAAEYAGLEKSTLHNYAKQGGVSAVPGRGDHGAG